VHRWQEPVRQRPRPDRAEHSHLRDAAAPGDLSNCQFLFIPRSEAENLGTWLTRAESRRLVTVSDIPGFAQLGGMIELPLEGERVGIVINRSSARKSGFEFNAQLLRLARVIDR
jgi:hypothetical protein